MDYLQKILTDFELHSVEGIRDCFEHGINPNEVINGKPLFFELVNMYTRGPLFRECIKVFVDYGLKFEDKVLLAVLMNDSTTLDTLLTSDKEASNKKYSFDSTFTPLYEATLLHICAEYNHMASAQIIIKHGADINAKAGLDAHGFGGQTPIFHTVNQDANKCLDTLNYLISQKADLTITGKRTCLG